MNQEERYRELELKYRDLARRERILRLEKFRYRRIIEELCRELDAMRMAADSVEQWVETLCLGLGVNLSRRNSQTATMSILKAVKGYVRERALLRAQVDWLAGRVSPGRCPLPDCGGSATREGCAECWRRESRKDAAWRMGADREGE